jgi:hypothetical protein
VITPLTTDGLPTGCEITRRFGTGLDGSCDGARLFVSKKVSTSQVCFGRVWRLICRVTVNEGSVSDCAVVLFAFCLLPEGKGWSSLSDLFFLI